MKQRHTGSEECLDFSSCLKLFCDAWPDAVLLRLGEEDCRVNNRFVSRFGLSDGDSCYTGDGLLAAVDPVYRRLVNKIWRSVDSHSTGRKSFFIKDRSEHNGDVCVRLSVFDFPAAGQDIKFAVIQDYSALSDLKQRFRHTRSRYEKLVEISGDIIYVHDQGKIVFINAAGARLLGAEDPAQVLGRPFLDFVHPDYREIVLSRFRDLTRNKREVRGAENKIVRLDGSVIDVQVFGTPCRYRDKPAVQVVLRDISRRKSTEQQLQTTYQELRTLLNSIQTLREEERTNMAREIHDELGNALTVLKYDVTWLLNHIRAGSSVTAAKGRDVLDRIDGIIGKVRKISTALRPDILDNLGIGAAIEWQAREFGKHSGIRCEVRLRPRTIVLERELATTIFRIFQETLTNVLRHAKATRCRVELVLLDDQVVLKVFDNGRGIKKKEIQNPASIGCIGIRERVEHWGGKVKIHGLDGKGSAVILAIPLPGWEETEK